MVIPQIQMKEPQRPRLGPFLELKLQKNKKRPHYFQNLIERSLASASVRSFNKLPPEIRKRMHDKFEFKSALSNYIKNVDVLNRHGSPLETLRLEQQILYCKNAYTANSNTITQSIIQDKTVKHTTDESTKIVGIEKENETNLDNHNAGPGAGRNDKRMLQPIENRCT